MLAIAGIGVASAGLWVLDVAADAPDIDTLKPADSGSNTQIFAADGTSLGYVQADVLRTPVALDKIPNRLQKATIAIEDEHFYDHGGVDYGAVVSAALENVEAGEVTQGGSTITQQLVRNLYIHDPEDTIQRKIIEAKMAIQYEDEYTKNQILNQYLNTASYGTNDGKTAVGVEAASQVYFDKDVSDLNLGEAALLAGLPQAPTDYNPFINPKGAKARRNEVLAGVARPGLHQPRHLLEGELRQGSGLHRGYHYEVRTQQYFFDFVQQELIDKYGVATAREGGLKVYTTLDPRLQAVAEQAIAAHPVSGAAAALVSTDVDTGEIKAMASSSSYDVSQFNLAATGGASPAPRSSPTCSPRRSPRASTRTAPTTRRRARSPSTRTAPTARRGASAAAPAARSASATRRRTRSTRSTRSWSPTSAGTTMDDMAKKMGVSSPLSEVPADVLGASDVTVLDQSNGFATIADGGVHHDPTAIAKVVFPDGHVDEPPKEPGNRVVSDGVAYTVADVMTGTLDYGTAACCDIPCPAAGKTGTTEEQADAWFVGYTPHVSTAVWVGNPDSRIALPGYGADLAAPIWQDYMEVAAAQPCDDFPEPQNPASLSSYYSEHTASSDSSSDDTTPPTPTGRRRRDTTTTPDATTDDTDKATTRTSTRPAPARSRRPPRTQVAARAAA